MMLSERAALAETIFGVDHRNEFNLEMNPYHPVGNNMLKRNPKASTLPIPKSFLHGTATLQHQHSWTTTTTSSEAKTKQENAEHNKNLISHHSPQSRIPRNLIATPRTAPDDSDRRFSSSSSGSSSTECLQNFAFDPRGTRTRATLPMASLPPYSGLRQRRATIPRAGSVSSEDDKVPPKTVANLASKFNALIEKNQPVVKTCAPVKTTSLRSKPPPPPVVQKPEIIASSIPKCRKVSYVQKLVINFEGNCGDGKTVLKDSTAEGGLSGLSATAKGEINRHFSSNLELSSRNSELSEFKGNPETVNLSQPSVLSHIRKYNSLDAVEKTEQCNGAGTTLNQSGGSCQKKITKQSSIPLPQPRRHFTVQIPPLPKHDMLYANTREEVNLRPNPSFLWDKTQRKMESRPRLKIDVPSQKDDTSNSNGYDEAEDPIYEQLPFVPCRDTEPHYKVPVAVATEPDEGWEDVSEDEDRNLDRAELTQSGENLTANSTKCRTKKKGQPKTSLRRSWSQSLRDLTVKDCDAKIETCTRNRCDASEEDYQDVSNSEDECESESNYSDSTNPEHHYESVYDMIAASVHSGEDHDIHKSVAEEADTSLEWVKSEDMVHALRPDPVSEDSGHGEQLISQSPEEDNEDGTRSTTTRVRRQWSLTKTDLRQEIALTIGKFKKKKSPSDETVEGKPKKRSWPSFRPKLSAARKPEKVSLKRSPSPKKESATFYLQSVVLVRSTEPVACSVITRTNTVQYSSSDSTDSGSQQYGEFAAPVVSVNVPTGAHTRRRRRTLPGSVLPRPKTAPPAPPVPLHGRPLAQLPRKCGSVDGSEYSSENSCGGNVKRMDSSDSEANNVCNILQSTRRSSEGSRSSLEIMKSKLQLPLMETSQDESSNKAKLRSSSSGSEMSYLEFSDNTSNSGSSKVSPFIDEPLYQIYIRDAVERAVRQNQTENSDEDYETLYPNTVIQPSKQSAMDLVLPTGSGQRTLWCELPEVQSSGLLKTIGPEEKKLQEAMFEVITSEASYLKSLDVLTRHFIRCPQFSPESRILSRKDRDILFSNVLAVKKVSERLLADLEKRWHESLLIEDICDIIYEHATKHFDVYITYVSNQICQGGLLKKLKDSNGQFVDVLKQLEMNPVCHNLSMYSFLMLPMQRITRLPLLIDAIYNRLNVDSKQSDTCKLALAALNKVVHECNEGARKVEGMQEMMALEQKLKFNEVKAIPLVTGSRCLVKKGELTRILLSDSAPKLPFGRWATRSTKQLVYFFLFTDLLVISKKKNNNCYTVIDYSPRNMIEVTELDNLDRFFEKPPEGCKNPFQLCIFQNHEFRMVEMLFSCTLESDRLRWTDALTPIKSENPEERIYEEWDCPQVQATHGYVAEQPDELSLEEADVVNVFRKMADGWYEGERIRDGLHGWFPSSYTKEIVSAHVRSRNLRQRYRLLTLSQSYLEEQKRKEKPAKDK